jgi:hypothetical protein
MSEADGKKIGELYAVWRNIKVILIRPISLSSKYTKYTKGTQYW